MKPIVLFGTGKIAEVIHHYMAHESDVEVAGFTCDPERITEDTFLGLPVVAFEDVTSRFPPEQYDMFVALGYHDLNKVRADRVAQAKAKGYALPSFVHPQAGLPTDTKLGENCFVMNQVCVHPRVTIGNNVFVWSGAMIGHHSIIGDNCWLTSHASICGTVKVGRNCFFASNACIGNDITIGDDCFLGANTLVTTDLENESVVITKSSEVLRLTTSQFLKMTALK